MDKKYIQQIYNWYYCPGEVLRSIGFYVNPYQQWDQAKFNHVFAFDGKYNLYVGQYSVYPLHINEIFDLDDKREYGMLYLADPPNPVSVIFNFLETKNATYLRKRLRGISQRFYDYGMPDSTIFISKKVDLWFPTIKAILGNKIMTKPDEKQLQKLLNS